MKLFFSLYRVLFCKAISGNYRWEIFFARSTEEDDIENGVGLFGDLIIWFTGSLDF